MSVRSKPWMKARKNNGVLFEPDANTVLWLPGQDDPQSATIRDRSGYGNDGSMTGAIWTRLSSGLWCPSFDGTDDQIDCGTGSSLDFTSEDFTIEAWVYLTSIAAADQALFWKAIINGSGYTFTLGDSGRLHMTTFQASVSQHTYTSTGVMVANTWYHIVGVRNGASITFRKNGASQGVQVSGTHIDPVTCTDNAYIGIDTNGNSDLSGYVALLRVYNIAVASAKTDSHYDQERHLFGV